MTWYVLDETNSTSYLSTLQQIDVVLPMHFTGNPNGVVTAAQPGIPGFDTAGGNAWISTGPANTPTTTWSQISLSGNGNASTSSPGIVQLATAAQTASGISTSLAVTPYGAAQTYATLGANSNITSLSGLTTPLSEAQGGSGLDASAASNGQLLIGNGSGFSLAAPTASSNKIQITLGSGTLAFDVNQGNLSLQSIGGALALASQVSGILGIANGGSGQANLPTNGQLLIGNTATEGFNLATITSGDDTIVNTVGNGTIDLTVNQSELSLGSLGGELNLASQVTGVLTGTHGGLGSNISTLADGHIPIGNGAGVTLALPTGNDGSITITPSSGGLDFAVDPSNVNLVDLAGEINLVTQTGNVLPLTKGGTGGTSQQSALNAIAPQGASNNQVIGYNSSSGNWLAQTISGTGTVTSVAATGDGTIFNSSITGSPITGSGTLNFNTALLTQSANEVLAGPTSGSAAKPTFRALVAADLPSISLTSGVSGVLPAGSGGTGAATVPAHKYFGNNSGSTGSGAFVSIVDADLPTSVVTSSGILSPLFTTAISNQALTFSQSNAPANSILSNDTGSSGAYAFNVLTLTAGTGLTGGGDLASSPTLAIATTGVTAGSYTNADITVNAEGQITAASNGSGSGGVSSVALTGDGVIFDSSISGSPITTSGTFDLSSSLATQTANTVLAGPTSGSAATPTFRALTLADLPASYGAPTITAKTTSFSASAGVWYTLTNPTANVVCTLPDATTCAGQTVAAFLTTNSHSVNLSLATVSSQTVGGLSAGSLSNLTSNGSNFMVWSDGANWQFFNRTAIDLTNGDTSVDALANGGVFGVLPGNLGGTGVNASTILEGDLLIGSPGAWTVTAGSTLAGVGISVSVGPGTLVINNALIPLINGPISTSFSISNADWYSISEVVNPTGNITATLPDATTVSGAKYSVIFLSNSHGKSITFATVSSQLINNASAASFYSLSAAGQMVTFISDGTNWITESFPLPISGTIFTPPNSGLQLIGNDAGSNNNTWAPLLVDGNYTTPNSSIINKCSFHYNSGSNTLSIQPNSIFNLGGGNRNSNFTATPGYQFNVDCSGGNVSVTLYDETAISVMTIITCSKGGNQVSFGTPSLGSNLINGKVASDLAPLTKPGESYLFMPMGTGAGWQAFYLPAVPGIASIAAGSGSGSSASVAISGNDRAGLITYTPGTGCTSASDQLDVTLGLITNPNAVALTPANANAAGLSGSGGTAVYAQVSSSGFSIYSGSSALTASTQYKWYYKLD
jgi:hypothetical protein